MQPAATVTTAHSAGGPQSGGRLGLIHRKLWEARRELELELARSEPGERPHLDSPCLSGAHCALGVANSHCNLTSFTCACLPHHVRLNSSMCLAPALLGYQCLADAQCQHKVANSLCSPETGLCECQPNFVTHRKDKCLPESKIDDYCLSDRQCQLADAHSYCHWRVAFAYGRCKCPPNYMTIRRPSAGATMEPTQMGPHCLPRLGDACLSGSECLMATPNSLCRHPLPPELLQLTWHTSNASSRRCFCQPGFRESRDRMRCEPSQEEEEAAAAAREATESQGQHPAPVLLTRLADAPVMNQNHQYEMVPAASSTSPLPSSSSSSSPSQEGSQEFELTSPREASQSPVPESSLASSTEASSITSSTPADVSSPAAPPITESVATPAPAPTQAPPATRGNAASLDTQELGHTITAGAPPTTPISSHSQPASLGQACRESRQCRAADPNSRCLAGRCECVAPSARCAANSTGCHQDTFQCHRSGQCISWYFVCDQIENCDDGSDELGCHKPTSEFPCPPQAFQCGGARQDGTCLGRARLCDGKRDCPDGSDEQHCTGNPVKQFQISAANQIHSNSSTSTTSHLCHPKAFTCDSGQCVPGHALCNAIADCQDGSDEHERLCQRSSVVFHRRKWAHGAYLGGLRSVTEARVSRFERGSRLLNRQQPSRQVQGTGGSSECPRNSFTCANGRCRSTAVLCSGRDGCGDNSDEAACQVCRCPAATS